MKSLAAQHSPFVASFNRLSVDEVKMNGWSRYTGANWKAKDRWRSGWEKRWLPTDISPESSFGLHRKNEPGMVGVNGKIMTPESSVFVHKWTDLVTLPFLFLLRLVFFAFVCIFNVFVLSTSPTFQEGKGFCVIPGQQPGDGEKKLRTTMVCITWCDTTGANGAKTDVGIVGVERAFFSLSSFFVKANQEILVTGRGELFHLAGGWVCVCNGRKIAVNIGCGVPLPVGTEERKWNDRGKLNFSIIIIGDYR